MTVSQKIKNLAFPFYPLLIGIYAVVQFWSANTGQVLPSVTLRAFRAALLVSVVVFLLAVALARSLQRGALISGFALLIIFFYGHFFSFIDQREITGFVVGRHRYILPLMIALLIAATIWALRTKRDLKTLNGALNLIIPALVLIAGAAPLYYEVTTARTLYNRAPGESDAVHADPTLPDVYYIILDGYTRSDVLLEEYNYDNSTFTNRLKELGFVIPDCTFSNYYKTTGSMSATLNMTYLDDLGISDTDANSSFSPSLAEFIIKSKVRAEFEALGYKTVAFRGFLPSQDIKNADYYFNLQEEREEQDWIGMHTFERMLMRGTLLRPVMEKYESNPLSLRSFPQWALAAIDLEVAESNDSSAEQTKQMKYYEQSRYQFEVMRQVPDIPDKKFVYSHFYTTHTPYVFDENGNPRLVDTSNEAYYIPTLVYTEPQILAIVENILKKSSVPPVIIIQGDHGKQSGLMHNKILNAYYLPGGKSAKVYATITPVNTFRLILSEYFGRDYSLLEDEIMVRTGDTIEHLPVTCDLK